MAGPQTPRPVSVPLRAPAIPTSILNRSPLFSPSDWQLSLMDGTLGSTMMIARVKNYASSGINNGPVPDRYDSEEGKMVASENRAVVGGHFALVRCSMPPP